MTGEGINAAEVMRALNVLREDVREDINSLREESRANNRAMVDQIAALTFVSDREYAADKVAAADARRSMNARITDVEKDVEKVDSRLTAAYRIALTGLFLPIAVAIIAALILSSIK